MRRTVLALGLLGSTLLAAGSARADPNDLALNRLSYFNPGAMGAPNVYAGGCGTEGAMFARCAPDNNLFFNLVNQLGGALAPSLAAPAGTIGYNGIYLGYEHTITSINGDADYWRRGTIGTDRDIARMQGTATRRERVANQLFVSRLHVRKAFPFGFELGLQTTYMHDSSLFALGLDIRWAPFEGFRTGVGYIPDLAIRGSVNTLVGNDQMYLTVVGLDASLSKRFTIAGMSTLTPYIGGQALLILGDSTVIDGTPNRSSYQECPRRNIVFGQDDMGHPTSNLICTGGTPIPGVANDSLNEMVFTPARILRWRAFGGLQYRFGIFTFTGEFAMDVQSRPGFFSDPPAGTGRPDPARPTVPQLPQMDNYQQWSMTFGLGVTFH